MNQAELDGYFTQLGDEVQTDHLAVICDQQGQASVGYISEYFSRRQNEVVS